MSHRSLATPRGARRGGPPRLWVLLLLALGPAHGRAAPLPADPAALTAPAEETAPAAAAPSAAPAEDTPPASGQGSLPGPGPAPDAAARPAPAPPPVPAALPPAAVPDELRQDLHPLRWDPAWPRFHLAEWVATGAFAALGITMQIVSPRGEPWVGGIGFDDAARDALRLPQLEDRRVARDFSDVLLTATIAYPFVIDAMVIAAWRHRAYDVAWQMTLINAEVLAVNVGLQGLANFIGNRQRPYVENCGAEEPLTSQDCQGSKQRRSFYSGHTAFTFASASLICSHHLNLELYGGGAPDIAACAVGYLAAAATGTLRMVGDQHYASDVLIGALVGTVTGLGLPWLLHYRHGPAPKKASSDGLRVKFVPHLTGAGLVGVF